MIIGAVNADREAVIRLTVRGPTGQGRRVEAVIDTGFDGWLSLPPALIARLRLPWRRRGLALLADGSESIFDVYEATVLWDRRRRRVPIDEVEAAPLVGMALLEGYELNAQVRAGGKVTIKPLPRPRRRGS
jgi:clan AA aspartic protease